MSETIGIGRLLAERYRLERPLARGGMGTVWRGEDLRLGVPVAVKLMSPTYLRSEGARARFELEGRMTARLRGPHIAQLFDVGVDAGVPFIVMELLVGEDLQTRLSRQGRLPLVPASHIAGQIARALEWAHSFGVVHRDVKPANVFLAVCGVDEVVKILDFGVAKWGTPAGEGEGTQTGMLIGSPSYMSPEQITSARAVGPRADLWSFGAVLFHMVCGWPPFPADSAVEVFRKIRSGDTPLASAFAADLPVELDSFFLRALAIRPEDRFPSAGAMAAAFARVAARRSPAVTAAIDQTEMDEDDVPTTAFIPAMTHTGTEYLSAEQQRSSATHQRVHASLPTEHLDARASPAPPPPLETRPARSLLQRWPVIVLSAMVPLSGLGAWLLAGQAMSAPPRTFAAAPAETALSPSSAAASALPLPPSSQDGDSDAPSSPTGSEGEAEPLVEAPSTGVPDPTVGPAPPASERARAAAPPQGKSALKILAPPAAPAPPATPAHVATAGSSAAVPRATDVGATDPKGEDPAVSGRLVRGRSNARK